MARERGHRDIRVALPLERADDAGKHLAADRRGNDLGKARQRNVALDVGELRRHLGLELGDDDHVHDVQPGEHDAGEERAGVKLHHGHAGRRTIDDQHDGRRNQDAEATACGDHAGRQANVVAGTQHRRQCQQAHQRHYRADDAGCGREHGAGDQRGHAQRARYARQRKMQALEQFLDQVGALDQVTHEHEQRDRDQHVVGHDRVGTLNHEVECLLDRDVRPL